MRELERRVVLSVLDRKWREHLYEMDYLREGIGLRGYAQRDPLVEYQREGFDMFMAIMDGIKEESVGFLFNLDVQLVDEDEQVEDDVAEEPLRRELRSLDQPDHDGHDHRPQITAKGLDQSRTPQHLSYSAPVGGRLGALGARRVRRRRPSRRPGRARRSPTPTTSSPRSAATRCAPAGRARSTSAATVLPAARRA